jgi:tetratricopeptide (TPR) repeat protein/predicted Ser/Thr protein kinase
MIRPGDRIGHIRVEGFLAEGGMGAVFVGFDERLERPVALKAIRSDRLDAAARARFLIEARLLSQLDHPNICRIHGYLEDREGDFLVLELIRGRTLRQALREGIEPGSRLAIAESVARALEAAHEKGIVHRDLKPSNVMLAEGGGVKVLDFGLARLESARLEPAEDSPSSTPSSGGSSGRWTPWALSSSDSMDSVGGSFRPVGTASNMSPEQARGEPLTAASDCYSLGLLLQELFTGSPPYNPGLSEPLLLVKAADGDTLPLSGVRDADLAALIRQLKSLAPEARPTAAAAAERLAWIRGKPGRRRLRLVAAAVVAAFLLGGLKYTLDLREERQRALEARRAAEQQAARADEVARFLENLFKASDPRLNRGEPPGSRELLRRGTERLGRELRDQPLLRAQLLDTLGGIHTELGLFDEAKPLLDEALAIRERLRGAGSVENAETLVHLGVLARLSGKGDAVALFRRALRILTQRLGPDSAEVADVLAKLGVALAAQGKLDEAETVLRQALALSVRLWGDRDLRVAKILHNLSGIAYYRDDRAGSEQFIRRALAIREAALPDDDPDLAGSREAMALLLQKEGRSAEAEKLLERLAASAEKVFGPDHPELARTLMNLGLAREDLDRQAEARRIFERSLAIDEKALEPGHPQRIRARDNLARHCREVPLADAASRELCRRHGL